MRFFDIMAVLYIAVWIYGALVILREARWQGNLVRLMAVIAIVIGPLGMLAYLGLRHIAHSAAVGALLPPSQRRRDISPS
jgi:ABC-type transport system involved in cytochrome c biogenesis permease subunit